MTDSVDKTDLKILKILQQDGRITNLQLSTDVGLSPAPTLERVKKLERAGVIKSYHAELDAGIMGMGIQAFMMVSLAINKNNAIEKFESKIADIPEIVDCFHLTGMADYLLRIMVTDIQAYDILIREKLSMIEEITSMQSLIVLSQVKKSNCLPLNYEG
jgi:Lrp/AsnC family leucine-responsive transcriptional regulator